MKNYSRQREAILDCLRKNRSHPTADEVYRLVRERIPNISLGTVYRNLADLAKEGQIISLDVGDGAVHYDGFIGPHIHFHCRRCNEIFDIALDEDILSEKASEQGFKPESSVHIVYGVCKKCNLLNGGK